MTLDPIRDGSNWYAYVGNDPINFVDPWGLEPNYAGMDSGYYYVGASDLNDYKEELKEATQKYTDDRPSGGRRFKDPYRINDYPGHSASYGDVPSDVAAPLGTPIYTVENETVEVVKWNSNDETLSEFTFKTEKDEEVIEVTVETKGTGFGYYVRTRSDDGVVRVDAHLDPDAESTQTWGSLLKKKNKLEKKYGDALVPDVRLPPNVELGQIGFTGNTTGPHDHHEGPEKIPPYSKENN